MTFDDDIDDFCRSSRCLIFFFSGAFHRRKMYACAGAMPDAF